MRAPTAHAHMHTHKHSHTRSHPHTHVHARTRPTLIAQRSASACIHGIPCTAQRPGKAGMHASARAHRGTPPHLLQHIGQAGRAQQQARALVVLLQDLGHRRVVEKAPVHEHDAGAVELRAIAWCQCVSRWHMSMVSVHEHMTRDQRLLTEQFVLRYSVCQDQNLKNIPLGH